MGGWGGTTSAALADSTQVCNRRAKNHTTDLEQTFFNGAAFVSWENVWGVWNGRSECDCDATRRVGALAPPLPRPLSHIARMGAACRPQHAADLLVALAGAPFCAQRDCVDTRQPEERRHGGSSDSDTPRVPRDGSCDPPAGHDFVGDDGAPGYAARGHYARARVAVRGSTGRRLSEVRLPALT